MDAEKLEQLRTDDANVTFVGQAAASNDVEVPGWAALLFGRRRRRALPMFVVDPAKLARALGELRGREDAEKRGRRDPQGAWLRDHAADESPEMFVEFKAGYEEGFGVSAKPGPPGPTPLPGLFGGGFGQQVEPPCPGGACPVSTPVGPAAGAPPPPAAPAPAPAPIVPLPAPLPAPTTPAIFTRVGDVMDFGAPTDEGGDHVGAPEPPLQLPMPQGQLPGLRPRLFPGLQLGRRWALPVFEVQPRATSAPVTQRAAPVAPAPVSFAEKCDSWILKEPLYTFPAVRCYLNDPWKRPTYRFLRSAVEAVRDAIVKGGTSGGTLTWGKLTSASDVHKKLTAMRDLWLPAENAAKAHSVLIAAWRTEKLGLTKPTGRVAEDAVLREIQALEWCLMRLWHHTGVGCGWPGATWPWESCSRTVALHGCWTDTWVRALTFYFS